MTFPLRGLEPGDPSGLTRTGPRPSGPDVSLCLPSWFWGAGKAAAAFLRHSWSQAGPGQRLGGGQPCRGGASPAPRALSAFLLAEVEKTAASDPRLSHAEWQSRLASLRPWVTPFHSHAPTDRVRTVTREETCSYLIYPTVFRGPPPVSHLIRISSLQVEFCSHETQSVWPSGQVAA